MRITLTVTFCLFLLFHSEARVDTLWVYSKSMNIDIGTTIILPENYDSSQWNYPVVYLLHGAGGDYGNWLRRVPDLEQYATDHQFILACPDGGLTSWYLDSPIDSTFRYETYITSELLPTVDSLYRTQPSPSRRAITGLSMGGHGALFLSMRHPNLFLCAGSMSGGVDLRPFPDNWDLPLRLGFLSEFPDNWNSHSVVFIASTIITKQNFIIDCGSDDFFLPVNRALHSVLLSRDIAHHYSERTGSHNWPYWRESIIEHLQFFAHEFCD
jgi:S-formylglutathione hydrolase FrmB